MMSCGFFCDFVRAGDRTGGYVHEGGEGCCLLAKAQAAPRVDVPTAPTRIRSLFLFF